MSLFLCNTLFSNHEDLFGGGGGQPGCFFFVGLYLLVCLLASTLQLLQITL